MAAQLAAESQGNYVQVNDITVYYEEYGSGEPLILLHGGTSTSQNWEPLIPTLSQHFRVITPDNRGHGRTSNGADELTYPGLADDLVAFAKAIQVEHPFVLGNSDGGQIGLEIAVRYGDFARAIVMGGTFYKSTDAYFNGLQGWGIQRPEDLDIEQMKQNAPDWVTSLQTAHVREDDPTYWQKLFRQVTALWYRPISYATEAFAKIEIPILIFIGDRDEVIPLEQAFEMYKMIPTAELAVVPNATHGTALGHVSMIPTILDFLKRHISQK